VKFTDLVQMAADLGAERLATGHYVQRIDGAAGAELHRAVDQTRDQSWFLFATTQAQLDRCLFPLGGFATNGVNMTKLESYMVEGEFSATQFLADVDGHPDDPHVKRALEELDFFSKEVRILGCYKAHPFRIATQKTG
jgi:prephenate dehydratase